MKKQLAIGIAGATAALIGGFKVVRQRVEREHETDAVAVAPGVSAETSAGIPIEELTREAEAVAPPSSPTVSKKSSKAELYDIAQDLGIKGRSKMTKDELLKAIEQAS